MADLSLYKLNQKTQFTDISFYEEINFGNSQQTSFTLDLSDYDIDFQHYKCIIGPAMDDDGIGTNNKLDRISMAQISVSGGSLTNNLIKFTLTAAQPTAGLGVFWVNILIEGFYNDEIMTDDTIISTFPYSTGGAITVGNTTLNGDIKLIGSGGTTLTPDANNNTITVYSSTQGTATSASVAYTLGPNDSSTYSVGSTSKPVYFSNGIPLAITSLDLSSGAITGGNFSTGSIKPKATNTYDLGAADKTYKNLYLSKGIYFPNTTSYIYGCYDKTGFIELGYTISDNKNINSIRIKSDNIILLSDNSYSNAKISLEWINSSADKSNIYIGDNIDITANYDINIKSGNDFNIITNGNGNINIDCNKNQFIVNNEKVFYSTNWVNAKLSNETTVSDLQGKIKNNVLYIIGNKAVLANTAYINIINNDIKSYFSNLGKSLACTCTIENSIAGIIIIDVVTADSDPNYGQIAIYPQAGHLNEHYTFNITIPLV